MDPDFTPLDARDTAAVIATAQEAVEPRVLDVDELYAVRDSSGALIPLDLEKYRDNPDRCRGTYELTDLESFISYVETHKDDAHSTIWVHPTEGKVVAVLDDNAAGKAAWREHLAKLTLTHSPEWELWTGKDGLDKLMDQQAFAEHLREGLPDIVEPDGADLLEIATTFEAKANVHFRSGVELGSGQKRFKYDEEIQASGTTKADGEVAVPEKFTLRLPCFLGEEPVQITANLIHRIPSGNLRLGYKLERPERVIDEALQRVADRLDDRFERVYRGTPAA